MSKRITLDIHSKSVMVDGKAVQVLGKISCAIEAGSFVSIIGPSGCGKSTLLRAIMGLDSDFTGEILIGHELVRGPGVDRGIVFQEPRLLPWSSVRDNIAFAIPASAQSVYANGQVERLLDFFGLGEFANAWPNQLSGGMMQRVALARALVNLPEVLLMDEPFGALDAHTRTLMQEELLGIFQSQFTTTAMVTHDVEEAVYLSDAVLILSARPGRLVELVRVGLSKPRDRSDPAFVALRFDILRRAFGGDARSQACGPECLAKHQSMDRTARN
jgi:sulfonate transport system ATP-binding protein